MIDRGDGSLYAGTTEALFKSPDGGASRTVKSGMRFGALAIDPQNPSTLYAATNNGVSKSTDGGTSWRTFNSGLSAMNNVIPGVQAVAVDPTTPSTVCAATGAITGAYPTPPGFFKSTDGAISWNRVNSLPTETSIRALVIAPQIPSAIYAATSVGLFITAGIGLGTWIVTGVRAHEDQTDHTDSYVPVNATITVSP